jgi:hypothetical protein
MLTAVAHRYCDLLNDLLARRVPVGGELSREEEDRFTDALDACRREMTADERSAVEKIFAVPKKIS